MKKIISLAFIFILSFQQIAFADTDKLKQKNPEPLHEKSGYNLVEFSKRKNNQEREVRRKVLIEYHRARAGSKIQEDKAGQNLPK